MHKSVIALVAFGLICAVVRKLTIVFVCVWQYSVHLTIKSVHLTIYLCIWGWPATIIENFILCVHADNVFGWVWQFCPLWNSIHYAHRQNDMYWITMTLCIIHQALSLCLDVRWACRNFIVQYLVNISSPVQQQMHYLNRSPFTTIFEWGQSSLYQTHTSRIIIHHMNKVYYSHVVNSISDCAPNSHAV